MAGQEEAVEVDLGMGPLQRGEEGHGRLRVLEGGGPRMPAGPNPTVAQIPDGQSHRGQVLGDRVKLVAPIRHPPEAAMKQADQGDAVGLREVEVSDLVGVWAVGKGEHSWRRRQPNARASPAGDECTSSQLDGFL